MNQRQLNQIARYAPVILNFNRPKPVIGGMEIQCRNCDAPSEFKNHQLAYALKVDKQLVCKSCEVKVPNCFKHIGDKFLQCKICKKEYYRENETKYFACYCMLSKKQTEKMLFEALNFDEFDDPRTISREESLLDMNHNVDIKLTLDNGIILYIEVEGGSHNSQAQKEKDRFQEEYFLENCKENEFIFRVHDDLINDKYQLERFADYIENLTLEGLNNQPIHRFNKDHFEEVEDYVEEWDGWY